MKSNYLLVHGSFGSPFSNWIPWLRAELEKDFAEKISNKQYCIHNGGHLNTESNYIEFKELLDNK